MISGIVLIWLVVGFIVSMALHAYSEPGPVSSKTLGQIVLAPFFVIRLVLVMWLWVASNLFDSVGIAGKQLIKGLDAAD